MLLNEYEKDERMTLKKKSVYHREQTVVKNSCVLQVHCQPAFAFIHQSLDIHSFYSPETKIRAGIGFSYPIFLVLEVFLF